MIVVFFGFFYSFLCVTWAKFFLGVVIWDLVKLTRDEEGTCCLLGKKCSEGFLVIFF